MFGDDTLFESQMRDFEAIENGENKNVDEQMHEAGTVEDFLEVFDEGGMTITSGMRSDYYYFNGIEDAVAAYTNEIDDYDVSAEFVKDLINYYEEKGLTKEADQVRRFGERYMEESKTKANEKREGEAFKEKVDKADEKSHRKVKEDNDLWGAIVDVIKKSDSKWEYVINLVSQVWNGGFQQWIDNGYATEEGTVAIKLLTALDTDAAKEMANLAQEAIASEYMELHKSSREEQDRLEPEEWEDIAEPLSPLDDKFYDGLDDRLINDIAARLNVSDFSKDKEKGESMTASTDSGFENLVDKFSQVEEDENKNEDLEIDRGKEESSLEVTEKDFDAVQDIAGNGGEGLVVLGAGGDPKDWVNGIIDLWRDEGIFEGTAEEAFSEIFKLTSTGGRTDLVMVFDDSASLDMGKMAMWRLRFGSCSWISDFVHNYASHYGGEDFETGLEVEDEIEDEFEAKTNEKEIKEEERKVDVDAVNAEFTKGSAARHAEDIHPELSQTSKERFVADTEKESAGPVDFVDKFNSVYLAEIESGKERDEAIRDALDIASDGAFARAEEAEQKEWFDKFSRFIETSEVPVDEGSQDEKKAVPTCGKCSKKHWPFKKCSEGADGKVDEDSVEDYIPTEDEEVPTEDEEVKGEEVAEVSDVDFRPLEAKLEQVLGIPVKLTSSTRPGRFGKKYITFSSDELVDHTGIFKAALTSASVESFSGGDINKEGVIWWTVTIRYEVKRGGSNGVDILQGAWYDTNTKEWTFKDV